MQRLGINKDRSEINVNLIAVRQKGQTGACTGCFFEAGTRGCDRGFCTPAERDDNQHIIWEGGDVAEMIASLGAVVYPPGAWHPTKWGVSMEGNKYFGETLLKALKKARESK
jgi:hypothetical protein